jgi:hypothetical protein
MTTRPQTILQNFGDTTFRDAIGAAGSGPLHAWINGAWFTSREARNPSI